MEQSQPQVDYTKILFQDIERELNKLRQSVDQIQSTQKESSSKLKELDTAVNGQQGGKIIPPNKLKTVLTQNEKKRYAEIGKRFLQGAESQFNRVKKRIKFKQGMRTTKETFLSGIEKIKEQKIQKQKTSFWKKLLGGLVIISLAAYIFRDKIAKMMPNLTQQSGSLVERVFKWVGTLIKGCYTFITDCIGGSVVSVFHRLMTQSIPKILQIFFLETLPQAIFNTSLAVLSAFSNAAGERFEQQTSHDQGVRQQMQQQLDDGASQAAEAAQRGQVVKNANGQYVRKQTNESQGMYSGPALQEIQAIQQKIKEGKSLSEAEIAKYRRGVGNLTIVDDKKNYDEMRSLLGKLIVVTKDTLQMSEGEGEGASGMSDSDWNTHFITTVKKGQFDTNSFMQYYKKHIAQARIGTEEQQKAAKIQVLARATAQAQGIVNEEKIQQMIKNLTDYYSNKELNQLDDFGNFIRDLYREQQKLNSTVERQQKILQERAQKMKPPLVSLQIHTITDLIAQPIAEFLKALTMFLQGGVDVSKISNVIKTGFEQLADYFNGFFKGTIGFLVNFLENIEGITVSVPGMMDAAAVEQAKKQGKEVPKQETVIGQTQAKEGSVALIADFGTLTVAPLADFVSQISEHEMKITSTIKETSTHVTNLQAAIQKLGELNVKERDYLGAVAAQLGVVDKGLLTHIQTNKRVIATTKSEVNRIGKLLEEMKNTPYKKDTYLLAQVDDL